MNNKDQLMMEILSDMFGVLNATQRNILKDSLIKRFSNYNISQNDNKYALMNLDEFNTYILNQYVVYKTMSGIAESTMCQYYREAKNLLFSLNKKAIDITTEDIELYLTAYKLKKNVTNTTLKNTKLFISPFFSFLKVKKYIQDNPCDYLASIKSDTIREKAFTKTEEEKMYKVCNCVRDRALLEFLFATGCRVGEIIKLNKYDINFDTKTIVVIGKGNKQREVFISDKAIFHLNEYLKLRNDNEDALFVANNSTKKRLTSSGIESILNKIGNKANVRNVHPHRCRATFATRMIDSGMDIYQVSKLLGHADVNTTMLYYRGTYNISSSYNKIVNN